MKKLPVAIQVYSIRENAEKDFVGTMKEIKSMGYDGVELAGLYGMSPEEIRDHLKEVGLTPISAHVSYQEFMENINDTVKRYATIGCKYVAIPYLTDDYRYGTENYNTFLKDLPQIAEECNKAGIVLLYHNHDFEFAKNSDGVYVLDALYEQFSADLLKTELDLCWVKVAGEEPTAYVRKYAGRCPVVHIKDFVPSPFDFRPVGYGIQDVPAILNEVIEAESEWIVVEQDGHSERTAMEDAKLSREYLKQLGW
ncbi:MAG: sugar phosphate isomerase [Anaerocolumna sp.]|jgi:sugar phosphate isomerase/epimerase|nr:sugar phosphate isomerase [Anaerocolumna sp.]